MDRENTSFQESVEQHLAANGFPSDGGLNEKWVKAAVGPIPFCFPNTKARRKAVPIHDFNHVLSGYGHDDIGEAEIGAWELGGGCKNYWAAWALNWAALTFGVVKAPRRMLHAFARGRRTGNLYGVDIKTVRDVPVEEVRRAMGLHKTCPVRVGDVTLFVGFALLAPVFGAILASAAIVTSPVWLAEGAHNGRREVA
jgi:hypothetical protein